MLEIILHILAAIGIILLALLAFLLTVTALVLFFPVSYRISGEKEEELTVAAKARWLFGLVRVSYSYPEPGHVRAKVLMFTVYDSRIPAEKKPEGDAAEKEKHRKKNSKKSNKKKMTGKTPEKAADAAGESAGQESDGVNDQSDGKETSEGAAISDEEAKAETDIKERIIGGEGIFVENQASSEKASNENTDGNPAQSGETEEAKRSGGVISQKIKKIQYTIRNIYDKIKGIWENISYYIELLQEEDTKQLFSYALGKLTVILKHLRPRRVKADILFGTGSPDTTGYAYGAYCMLSGAWGKGIVVTPDFEQQIFKARFDARGRITVWVLGINMLKIILDKRLQGFIAKMKAGKKSSSSK